MKRISELLTLLLLLCIHTVFVYAETSVAKILVVHSYGSTHVCGKPQGDGVARALAEHGWLQGENLELRSVFMDTKKTTPHLRQSANRGVLHCRLSRNLTLR
ncbi:MAG: hypothetical protein ABW170_06950 [Candidatus Thiodiazotropha sp. L084R]